MIYFEDDILNFLTIGSISLHGLHLTQFTQKKYFYKKNWSAFRRDVNEEDVKLWDVFILEDVPRCRPLDDDVSIIFLVCE